ncbi:MAG TPA: hypothetical protein VHX88_07510 [Solirubrobacteraceae bacterium]|jgi:hypothetical protein|nr:hypothetical protein [Solirubrobacteraceae bacterium]
MGFVLTVTAAFVIWIVGWTITGGKGLDCFLVTLAILLVGVGVRGMLLNLPGRFRSRS